MEEETISSNIRKDDQIEKLLFDNSEEEITNDYIEWSLNSDYLIKKGKEFREQIDLYSTSIICINIEKSFNCSNVC
jgi:hypothetical protein